MASDCWGRSATSLRWKGSLVSPNVDLIMACLTDRGHAQARIGVHIQRCCLAHAVAGEIDHEAVPAQAVVTHLNGLLPQIDRALIALRIDREDIGLADLAVLLDEEH